MTEAAKRHFQPRSKKYTANAANGNAIKNTRFKIKPRTVNWPKRYSESWSHAQFRWLDAERAEAERKAIADAQKIVAIWNARQVDGRALWSYPTIGAAVAAGLPWLSSPAPTP
jgi:hypothetical protein